jgi:hypothetical protein
MAAIDGKQGTGVSGAPGGWTRGPLDVGAVHTRLLRHL